MFQSRSSAAYLAGAALCWGLGTVLSKYALGGFESSVLLPLQLACSVLLLGCIVLATGSSVRSVEHARKIAALGILNPGIAYLLGLIALAQISASLSVIIWATEPVLIVVMAFLILRERLPLGSVVCLATAMTGVALIVSTPTVDGVAWVGVALTFASVLACALYSILLGRMELNDGTLPMVLLQQLAALGFALLAFSVTRRFSGSVHATLLQTVSAILSGAFYYGIAFLLYVAGLRRTSAARAGMSLTLIPVFGLFFSRSLLGETLHTKQLLGSVVVIASMAVLAARSSKAEVPEEGSTVRSG